MKINDILRKIELPQTLVKSKNLVHKNLKRGDFVSVIYYDIEKEQIKIQQFTGVCYLFKSKGLNTKIGISTLVSKVNIKQMFFLYSKTVLDISILKK